jgi:hypothetical protein
MYNRDRKHADKIKNSHFSAIPKSISDFTIEKQLSNALYFSRLVRDTTRLEDALARPESVEVLVARVQIAGDVVARLDHYAQSVPSELKDRLLNGKLLNDFRQYCVDLSEGKTPTPEKVKYFRRMGAAFSSGFAMNGF